MGTMKEFKTQICTTIEQSKRLLDLGLKPETADCTWAIINGEPVAFIGQTKINCSKITINGNEEAKREIIHYPAWSLHRLLCMLDFDNADTFNIMPNLAYEDVIATISLGIDCGVFNKEYLKQ